MKSLLRPMWVVLIAAAGCSSDGEPTGPGGGGGGNTRTVQLNAATFSPANLTINAGETVVWQNNGGTHTITPDGHSTWNAVGTSGTGEALRVTFTTPGTYEYYCDPHRAFGMTGRIVVN